MSYRIFDLYTNVTSPAYQYAQAEGQLHCQWGIVTKELQIFIETHRTSLWQWIGHIFLYWSQTVNTRVGMNCTNLNKAFRILANRPIDVTVLVRTTPTNLTLDSEYSKRGFYELLFYSIGQNLAKLTQ